MKENRFVLAKNWIENNNSERLEAFFKLPMHTPTKDQLLTLIKLAFQFSHYAIVTHLLLSRAEAAELTIDDLKELMTSTTDKVAINCLVLYTLQKITNKDDFLLLFKFALERQLTELIDVLHSSPFVEELEPDELLSLLKITITTADLANFAKLLPQTEAKRDALSLTTLIYQTCIEGRLNIIQHLLSTIPSLWATCFGQALLKASQKENAGIVEYLLLNGQIHQEEITAYHKKIGSALKNMISSKNEQSAIILIKALSHDTQHFNLAYDILEQIQGQPPVKFISTLQALLLSAKEIPKVAPIITQEEYASSSSRNCSTSSTPPTPTSVQSHPISTDELLDAWQKALKVKDPSTLCDLLTSNRAALTLNRMKNTFEQLAITGDLVGIKLLLSLKQGTNSCIISNTRQACIEAALITAHLENKLPIVQYLLENEKYTSTAAPFRVLLGSMRPLNKLTVSLLLKKISFSKKEIQEAQTTLHQIHTAMANSPTSAFKAINEALIFSLNKNPTLPISTSPLSGSSTSTPRYSNLPKPASSYNSLPPSFRFSLSSPAASSTTLFKPAPPTPAVVNKGPSTKECSAATGIIDDETSTDKCLATMVLIPNNSEDETEMDLIDESDDDEAADVFTMCKL